ncbi:MAG: hypothetical protein KDE19_13015 [Caldilineaceae bacterium]|nr:hypothetical protein [Caldilineaceae bacterium]
MNVLFWGTQSLFAQRTLFGLSQCHDLQAVMVPAPSTQMRPVQQFTTQPAHGNPHKLPATTSALAAQLQLPIYGIHRLRHAETTAFLRSLAPDLVCVACFPWRIPPALLAIPTFGFVNLHPSLLPAYRGPAPLFWQLRDGLRTIGITAHWMDATFDTGDIVAQQTFLLPDGAGAPEIDAALADIGVTLLASLLTDLAAGITPRQQQPPGGTRHSWPTAADFALDPAWSARHAFAFMRGTAEWQQPYSIVQSDHALALHTALAYDASASQSQFIVAQASHVAIQFTPGVLFATRTPTIGQRFPTDITLEME